MSIKDSIEIATRGIGEDDHFLEVVFLKLSLHQTKSLEQKQEL